MMTHQGRLLTEEDVEEIVKDLTDKLNRALTVLSIGRIISEDEGLSQWLFRLEFSVVSPLYYRLQRHLIDWGTRTHHPQLNTLKVTEYLDKENKKYNDYLQ